MRTELRNGRTLKFECELTSSFHTTQRPYANLLKCAPFILGSTLRGSILKYLIEQNCAVKDIEKLRALNDSTEIARFHSLCQVDCPVKLFFSNPKKPLAIFSFGHFFDLNKSYSAVTRIALTRDNRAASEGKLANVECIVPNTNFEFRITLFEDALDIIKAIKKTVEYVGQYVGVGRFKSVGFGRFKVKNVSERDVSEIINDKLNRVELKRELKIIFTTPLIFDNGSKPLGIEEEDLKSMLSTLLLQRVQEILLNSPVNLTPLGITDMSARINPEFVRRWSLECSKPENHLVAWQGSEFCFKTTLDDNTELQLIIASTFGIGEWRDIGYGEFQVESNE